MNKYNSIQLYEQMLRSRLFEEGVSVLWEQGLISGEMHASLGEEAIAAGVVCQLEDGDSMALDHRGTAPLVMRGGLAGALTRQPAVLRLAEHPTGCGLRRLACLAKG
jgi:pyruvate dehydrogenase E1 component alpha subunit